MTPLDISGVEIPGHKQLVCTPLDLYVDGSDCNALMSGLPSNTFWLKLEANACGAIDDDIIPYTDQALDCDTEQCGECPSVGAPVRLTNGNMRYQERLPMPSMVDGDRILTYDTRNHRRGWFGTGWWSVFDAFAEDTGTGYRVVTEENRSIRFDAAGYQIWPATGPLGKIDDFGTSGFVYHEPDGNTVRRFYQDGRLYQIELLADSSSIDITYTDGMPATVEDGAGNWSREVYPVGFATGSDETWYFIDEMIVRDPGSLESTTWRFGYENVSGSSTFDEYRLNDITVNSLPWRTYNYNTRGQMRSAVDGEDTVIESHEYYSVDPKNKEPGLAGFTKTSRTAGENINLIEYRVDPSKVLGRAPKPALGEYVSRVTWATSDPLNPTKVVEYYIRPVLQNPTGTVLAPHRVYEVNGDCECGGDFLSFARDDNGRVILKQEASGYVTKFDYDDLAYPGVNRPASITRGLYPDQNCDPIGDPAGCWRDPEALALAGLNASEAVTVDQEFDNPVTGQWPNRVTEVHRASVVPGAQNNTSQTTTYHPVSGAITTSTTFGYVWDHENDIAAPVSRITETLLYDGTEGAIFDPNDHHSGIQFQSVWEVEPQPGGLRKETDGPLVEDPDNSDLARFVYYPSVAGAPLAGRLAARWVAGDKPDESDDQVVVYNDYDVFGNPTEIIDPRGVVTKLVYDYLGRLEESRLMANCDLNPISEDPLCGQDLTTSYTYYGTTNRVEVITSPGGSVTKLTYDATWGRFRNTWRGPSVNDLPEVIQRWLNDDTGAVEWEKQWRSVGSTWTTYRMTEYEYNTAGRLERTIRPSESNDPDPGIEVYEYDRAGNLKTYKDAIHATANLEYFYDALGRLKEVSQLSDETSSTWIDTAYTYDSQGNLRSVTDANGNVTEYGVDDFGQTYLIDSPVTGITKMAYDAAGRLVERVDARGATESRVYGLSGGPTSIAFTLGTDVETITNEYSFGRKVSATAGDVLEDWGYDRRGALLTYQRSDQTTVLESLILEYNKDGALAKRRRGESEIVDFAPDWAGRPSAVYYTAPSSSASAQTLVSAIEWLPQGPMSRIQRGTTADETYTFDWQYRMTGITVTGAGGALIDRDLGYDNAGNLLTVDDLLDPTRDRAHTYDDLGRLTHAEGPFGPNRQIDYEYDDIGSRMRRDVYETEPVYTRGSILERFQFEGSTPLITSYLRLVKFASKFYDVYNDESGNMTQDVGAEYHYSPRGKMLERLPIGASAQQTWHFDYDAAGLRVRTVAPAPASTETLHYHLPGGEQFFEEERVSGVASRAWTHISVGGRLLAQVEHSYSAGQYVSSEIRHVESDHIAFPIMTLDDGGAVIWQALDVHPFGEIVTSTGTADPMLRYPGQWALRGDYQIMPELVSNGYRWYRPGWGRYTQSDPIGLDGGVHLFNYASNNPVNNTDPSGLFTNTLRCFYWTAKCANRGIDCADFWRCEIGKMGAEEKADVYDRASVTAGRTIGTQEGFLFWFCFETLDECKKMIKYCGTAAVKPPFGGKPG